jgi:predicted nucleic acid-binding protein
MKQVCLDANIWIKILTEEPDTGQAQDLVVQLFKERTQIIAPSIMKMEVGSILRKKWARNLLNHESLNELWNKFLTLPIVYVEPKQTFDIAWRIAESNGMVHLYDAIYLAISEGITFWTADERLVNSVKQTNVTIRLLGS